MTNKTKARSRSKIMSRSSKAKKHNQNNNRTKKTRGRPYQHGRGDGKSNPWWHMGLGLTDKERNYKFARSIMTYIGHWYIYKPIIIKKYGTDIIRPERPIKLTIIEIDKAFEQTKHELMVLLANPDTNPKEQSKKLYKLSNDIFNYHDDVEYALKVKQNYTERNNKTAAEYRDLLQEINNKLARCTKTINKPEYKPATRTNFETLVTIMTNVNRLYDDMYYKI